MKKSILVVALTCGISGVFAQDLTSKKGEPILPEAGDWAISMSADPIFTFLGNAFNGTQNHAGPNTNFLGNQTIIGKKFIDEKNAYRLIARLGFNSINDKNLVLDDAQTGSVINFPEQQARVEDRRSTKNTHIALGLGKEMRRGKTRLQGFYGADALIWVSMMSKKYKYGNVMSETNVSSTTGGATTTTPMSTKWDLPLDPDGTFAEAASASRPIKQKTGMTFGIGIRGFIGAEYFLLPKISLGAEYGWGVGFQLTTKGKVTTEEGGLPNAVAEIERETAGNSRFGFDTDINNGNIFGFGNGAGGTATLRVSFHF